MKRKQKLMDLEAEILADALLELAAQSGAADDLVERLIATPTENIQRFRKKLTGLKRSRRFIDRDDKKLTELLYRKFRSYHSSEKLEDLLAVIGSDKRNEIISKEIVLIHTNPILRESDADFLVSVGKTEEAERLILERAEQLDGGYYGCLISLAKTMESENRKLAATLIYRSLLISILERGYTKAYPHGVRYLNKLDKLAILITQWMKFDTHETFKDQIYLSHGRKYSFWSKYEH